MRMVRIPQLKGQGLKTTSRGPIVRLTYATFSLTFASTG